MCPRRSRCSFPAAGTTRSPNHSPLDVGSVNKVIHNCPSLVSSIACADCRRPAHRILYCCPDQGFQSAQGQAPTGHRRALGRQAGEERATPAVSVAISVQEGSSSQGAFDQILTCLSFAKTPKTSLACGKPSAPTTSPTAPAALG